MIEFNEELKDIAKEFRNTFGYSIPMSMIPPTINNNVLIDAVRKCINCKEDRLLEILGVKYDSNILF